MSMLVGNPSTSSAAQNAANNASRSGGDLGQADFLLLLTEQLKHQDPLKPLESNQFLAQLAQFSTVQGIQGLQSSFDGLASSVSNEQALQGASLIGHDALVASERFELAPEGTMRGAIDTPIAGQVTIEISDASGNVVRRLSYDAAVGPLAFEWDGMTATGEQAPPGNYSIAARVSSGGTTEALRPHIAARVNSVYFTSNGLVLDLAGVGSVPFSAVRRISG